MSIKCKGLERAETATQGVRRAMVSPSMVIWVGSPLKEGELVSVFGQSERQECEFWMYRHVDGTHILFDRDGNIEAMDGEVSKETKMSVVVSIGERPSDMYALICYEHDSQAMPGKNRLLLSVEEVGLPFWGVFKVFAEARKALRSVAQSKVSIRLCDSWQNPMFYWIEEA